MKIHIGIIESDFDEKNSNHSLWSNESEIKGWGKRYKVRIPGVHSEDKAVTPSSALPIAEIIYPVTAGTGHDACYQTDNLKPGSTVILWEDDNKRLFITGCKGNNEKTNLFRGEPNQGFIPYSLTLSGPSFNFSTVDNKFFESTSNAAYLNNWANFYELSDGKRTSPLTSSSICERAPLGQIQITIQNFIKDINEAKLWLAKQKKSLQQPIQVGISTGENLNKSIDNQQLFQNIQKPVTQTYSIDQWLTSKIQNVSKDISKFLKDVSNRIETGVTNLINDALKKVYYTLFPKQQQELKVKVETANDLIACLFRKIVRNLLKMVANFLKSAADNITNPAICIIENFIGGLFGKILGLITSAIDAILQPLNAILGIFDIASDLLNIVEDVLTTLSCDEQPSCPKIQEWSLWEGTESVFTTTNFSDIFNKIKSFSASVQDSIDPDNFNFDLDFSDIFANNCNVGALACGPPTVKFIGGGGSNASGNAIINSLGQIIGIDITSSGRNYSSPPVIKFADNCGNGSGAIGRAVIGPVFVSIPSSSIIGLNTNTSGISTNTTNTGIGTTVIETTGVINVIIEDTGNGYLPVSDGSLGATGLTLSDKLINPTIKYPISSNGSYSVIMKLCEIIIDDGGFGYNQSDTILINPSNGAVARPYFTTGGSLYKIEILSKGEGFIEPPNITVVSKTGFNAVLIPRLCVEQIGEQINSTALDKIIDVVDCPGK
jgi:hypothetical protein